MIDVDQIDEQFSTYPHGRREFVLDRDDFQTVIAALRFAADRDPDNSRDAYSLREDLLAALGIPEDLSDSRYH